MGVDFFPCDNCGEAICDCGDYVKCVCGRTWCDMGCATAEDYHPAGYSDGISDSYETEASCAYCRQEDAEDTDLFDYLLRQYNLTRDQVLEGWRNEQRNRDSPDAA